MNMDKINDYNINGTLRHPDNDTNSNHSEIDQVVTNTIKVTDRANEEEIMKTYGSTEKGENAEIIMQSGDKSDMIDKLNDYDQRNQEELL